MQLWYIFHRVYYTETSGLFVEGCSRREERKILRCQTTALSISNHRIRTTITIRSSSVTMTTTTTKTTRMKTTTTTTTRWTTRTTTTRRRTLVGRCAALRRGQRRARTTARDFAPPTGRRTRREHRTSTCCTRLRPTARQRVSPTSSVSPVDITSARLRKSLQPLINPNE